MKESDSAEVLQSKWDYRIAKWEAVMQEQFDLVYFGKFDSRAVDEMSVHERKYFYDLLIKVRTNSPDESELEDYMV